MLSKISAPCTHLIDQQMQRWPRLLVGFVGSISKIVLVFTKLLFHWDDYSCYWTETRQVQLRSIFCAVERIVRNWTCLFVVVCTEPRTGFSLKWGTMSRLLCLRWRSGMLLRCGAGTWSATLVPYAEYKLWVSGYLSWDLVIWGSSDVIDAILRTLLISQCHYTHYCFHSC